LKISFNFFKKYAIKIDNTLDIYTFDFLVKFPFSTIFKLSFPVVIISFLLVSLTVLKKNQAEKLQIITTKNQSKLESLGRQLTQGAEYLTSEISCI
jgi:hypothetical protein